MRFITLFIAFLLVALLPGILSCNNPDKDNTGHTEIMKWPDGKRGAVSLTYDGGTINQFRVAMPIMDSLNFPGSFFIVTGEIKDSEYKGKFIGRDIGEISREALTIPTDSNNVYERASAMRFIATEGIVEFHTRAGDLYEVGKFKESYSQVDEAYQRAQTGNVPEVSGTVKDLKSAELISWDEMRDISKKGHEFASHSVSHPQFAILDDVNLQYELEKSREEILNHLGREHTFSMECPYGTENQRVMKETFRVYPAARNRMPDPYLEELNRWNKMNPGESLKEYVQWQRGPKSKTPMDLMQSWIDTTAVNNNVWLVLVFHGIEGVGWEPLSGEIVDTYFNYIKSKEDDLWVATFRDVTKYIRERMNAEVTSSRKGDEIHVNVKHSLDSELYDLDLTMKTIVPDNWESIDLTQNGTKLDYEIGYEPSGRFIKYRAQPNTGGIIISLNPGL